MKRSILILAVLAVVVGCGAPTGYSFDNFESPNPLLAGRIQEMIDEIPYLKEENRVTHLKKIVYKGELTIPLLLKAMEEGDPRLRSNVMWILGRIRSSKAVPYMVKYLEDADEVVVFETALALLNMNDDTGVPVLIRGLTHDSPVCRYNSHNALKHWSGNNFEYDHLAPAEANEKPLHSWMTWWNERKGQDIFSFDTPTLPVAAPPVGN